MRTPRRAVLLGGLALSVGACGRRSDVPAVQAALRSAVEALPEPFRTLSHWNPIFYLIDGARYGFAGVSDAPALRGFLVCGLAVALVLALAWRWLDRGYRMKA